MGKVRVNGFGCIWHLVTRAAFNSGKVDIVAINDRFIDLNYIVYMFWYDSFNSTVKAEDGKPVSHLPRVRSTTIKWGVQWGLEKAGAYLKDGAKRVIISTPPVNASMFVMGVNHENYDNSLKIVSSASCTTNCLASSLAKVIHNNSGIVEGLVIIIHAIPPTQKTVEGPIGSCAMMAKGIPAKAIGKVIPELNEKLTGMAFYVPTLDMTVTCCLQKAAKYDDINKVVKQALEGPKGMVGYTENEVVSSTFNSDTHSSIFDGGAGIALNDHFKLISWYYNEFDYSNQVLDLMAHMASKE
uniref:Glyceraldehyde-3-phosphate dehydrogenase n=1 Tax=Mustela putorius furo TaxID=9669 RepID=M3XZD5_MUSPF